MKKSVFFLAMLMLLCCAACAMGERACVNATSGSGTVNLREQASRDARVAAKVYSGAEVEVIASVGGGWSQVRLGTTTGYMMSEFLAASGADKTYAVKVASPYGTRSVILRDKASNAYDAVAMTQVGESVRVLGESGEFLIVRTEKGVVGWLAKEETK